MGGKSDLKYCTSLVFSALLLSLELVKAGPLEIRYEMDLRFSPAGGGLTASVAGINRIWLRNGWDRPLGEIYLINTANFPAGSDDPVRPQTTLGAIRCSSLGKVTAVGDAVTAVGLFPALAPGESVVIDIPFETWLTDRPSQRLPTVGSRQDTIIYNLINFYPGVAFFNTDGWQLPDSPGPARPAANLAEYEVTISYPQEFTLGSSAHLLQTVELTSDLVRSKLRYPQALHFSAVLGNHFERESLDIDGLQVELLFTPGNHNRARKISMALPELVQFYRERFGPCPHDKLLITMGYSLDAHSITATNYIIFQDGIDNELQLLPREIIRQWFGHAINADISYETWLNESFTEYAAWLYRQTKEPDPERSFFESARALSTIWKDFDKLSAEEIMRLIYDLLGPQVVPPVYQPERRLDWENQAQLYSRYIVGNHALQMLQTAIGDSLMHKIMYAYATENVWRTVNTETFIATIDRFTNNQIGDNFRLALTTNLRPDYKIIGVETTGRKDRRWDNRIVTGFDGEWMLPVDLEVVTAERDTIRFEQVRFHKSSSINLVTDSPVIGARLDPDKRTFDSNRYNNRWPRSFLLQPIYGLPSWEVYKLYYRPVIRRDWRDNWRLGMRVSGGLGLNLMPILPAFYQNSFDLELTLSPALDKQQWGFKFGYRTPLGSVERTFWEVRSSWEYPRNEQTLSLSRYLGKTRYLVANRRSSYQRLTGLLKRTEFSAAAPDRQWERGKMLALQGDYVRFRYDSEQRSNLQVAVLAGQAIRKNGGVFYRVSAIGDVEQHLGGIIIARAHLENGLVWDDRPSDYLRYRLEHQLRAWRPREEFVPLFRGFTPVADRRWDSVLGGGFSIGAETRLPVWPMVYIDAALVEGSGGNLLKRWDRLWENPVYASAGIGIESQTLLEMGLYLPLWISHPLDHGSRWGWRWLVQWGFYF
ncbi:MAG: M1 family aminopeptidase [Candidatus Neomarinimicrobiota bacterium]